MVQVSFRSGSHQNFNACRSTLPCGTHLFNGLKHTWKYISGRLFILFVPRYSATMCTEHIEWHCTNAIFSMHYCKAAGMNGSQMSRFYKLGLFLVNSALPSTVKSVWPERFFFFCCSLSYHKCFLILPDRIYIVALKSLWIEVAAEVRSVLPSSLCCHLKPSCFSHGCSPAVLDKSGHHTFLGQRMGRDQRWFPSKGHTGSKALFPRITDRKPHAVVHTVWHSSLDQLVMLLCLKMHLSWYAISLCKCVTLCMRTCLKLKWNFTLSTNIKCILSLCC